MAPILAIPEFAGTPLLLVAVAAVAVATGAVAGIGGPGGAFLIATLFSVVALSPAGVAGTASAIFLAASLTAAAIYARSGDVDWRMALLLVPTTVLGTQVGAYVNARVSAGLFGVILAVLLALVGARIVHRELRGIQPIVELDARSLGGGLALAGIGFAVGIVGGLTGIAGPAVATPLLVALGVPALTAIGTAQVQALVLTAATATTYLLRGAVRPPLVAVLAPLFVAGVVGGWYVAHRVEAGRLRLAIGVLLLLFAPTLVL